MIKTTVQDLSTGNSMKIEDNGATKVYVIPSPPVNDFNPALPFAEYIKLNGTGTDSLLIDGSVTPQNFFIGAKSYDVYVNTLVFTIADAGALLNQFGAIASLTNGLTFFYFNQEEGQYDIETALKTNFDMVKLANFEPSFGSGNDAFRANNVVGASEAFVGVIDIEDVFGLQWGVKLRKNSTDRIGFIVNDNLTALDGFNVKAYGIRI